MEKTIDLLNTLPESQIETIYSFVQFLSLQQNTVKSVDTESLDDIFDNIVGVLSDTGKNYDIVMELFRKIKNSKAIAYITASSITDLFYIIHKKTHNINQTYIIMKNIFRLVVILSVTEQDIQEAFKQKWKDFEDCA